MGKDFTATITGDSEWAEMWRRVHGCDTVYLKSFIPGFADLPGKPDTLIYELDVALLTDEQRQRLVQHIADTFGLDMAEVDRDLDIIGCPVLAEDLTVTVHNPQRWVD